MKKRDPASIRFFNLPGIKNVRVVYGTKVTNDFPRHVHQALCLGIVDRGARIISYGGSSTVIPTNGLFVLNPGISHSCKPGDAQGHSYRIICVNPEVLQTIAAQIDEKDQPVPYFPDSLLADKELAMRTSQFLTLVEQPGSLLARESALLSLLSQLMLRHGDKPPQLCRAGLPAATHKRVCDFIGVHYTESLSLTQLSQVAGLSPFHFQRLFLKNTGISPHEYLAQFRIRKARELLLQGRTLADVALDTGFVDQSHFTRSFKRIVGIPPGRFITLHPGYLAVG
jgi:AraC-like DNA-binding protein